jgi:hypothetical protein
MTTYGPLRAVDVSDEYVVSIFRFQKQAKLYLMYAPFLFLCWLTEPQDGGDIYLRNVGWLLTNYKALCSKRYHLLIEPKIFQTIFSIILYDSINI